MLMILLKLTIHTVRKISFTVDDYENDLYFRVFFFCHNHGIFQV